MSPLQRLRTFIAEAGPVDGVTFASNHPSPPRGAQMMALSARDARWLVEHIEVLERAVQLAAAPAAVATPTRLTVMPDPDGGAA